MPEISQPYPQLEIDDSPDWVIPPLATTTCNEKGQIAPMVQSRQPTNKANSTLDMGTEAMAAATENKVTQIEGSRLTYTFNQWQNSPSVTFELATRGSELLATTTSPEVHRALHENQHLYAAIIRYQFVMKSRVMSDNANKGNNSLSKKIINHVEYSPY